MGNRPNRKATTGSKKLQIREAVEADLNDALLIERLTFGHDMERLGMRICDSVDLSWRIDRAQ